MLINLRIIHFILSPFVNAVLKIMKTELAWFGKPSRLASLANMDRSVTIGSSTIKPSSAVRDLGVILDAELTMKPQISRVTSTPPASTNYAD